MFVISGTNAVAVLVIYFLERLSELHGKKLLDVEVCFKAV